MGGIEGGSRVRAGRAALLAVRTCLPPSSYQVRAGGGLRSRIPHAATASTLINSFILLRYVPRHKLRYVPRHPNLICSPLHRCGTPPPTTHMMVKAPQSTALYCCGTPWRGNSRGQSLVSSSTPQLSLDSSDSHLARCSISSGSLPCKGGERGGGHLARCSISSGSLPCKGGGKGYGGGELIRGEGEGRRGDVDHDS